MKRNVDLTDARTFSRNRPLIILKPWEQNSVVSKDIQEDGNDKWGIMQGNSMVRNSKKLCKQFGDQIHCDCCGRLMFPWNSRDMLCRKCNARIEGKVPYNWNLMLK